MTSRLLLTWLAISSFFLAIGSSLTSLSLVTIRKPYVHIYDEPSTEAPVTEVIEYDQTSLTCPLPYMSSSAQTGCNCNTSLFIMLLCLEVDYPGIKQCPTLRWLFTISG